MDIKFPPSIFGARCDLLMDLVILIIIIFQPILWYSIKMVRENAEYRKHKKIQLIIFVILIIVIILFELDIRKYGGLFEMVKGSSYENTLMLKVMVYFHTLVSALTSLIWIGLIISSLIKFPTPPEPNDFSSRHKFWGKTAMWAMTITCITGVIVYIFGFIL